MKVYERWVGSYVTRAKRHPFRWLALYVAITAVGIYFARTLPISMDLKRLLPDDTPSVEALAEVARRRGSTELYTIALESPDPHANARFMEDISARIAEWPEAKWVQIDQDTTFFRDHLLYYLPLERLESLQDFISRALRCELQRGNPLFVEVGSACDEPVETWDLGEWLGPEVATDMGLPQAWADEWRDVMSDSDGTGEGTGGAVAGAGLGTGDAGANGQSATVELPEHQRGYLLSGNGEIGVVYTQLDRSSTDIRFANDMERRGAALIEELNPASYHPELRAEVVGAFQTLNEARSAQSDVDKSLAISLSLVGAILLLYFRRIRGLFLVVIPLTMGVAWSMGLARITIGELNLYTMFVGSLLVGIGTDYGVHLYGRTLENFREGAPIDDAMGHAMRSTGKAIFISALTATCAFLTLIISHFRGFAQYGMLTSFGVGLCMLSALLVTPPLCFAFERLWAHKRRANAADKPAPERPAAAPGSNRPWLVAAALVGILAVGAVFLAPRAQFEYDFRNLRGESSTSGIRYGQAVGRGMSTTPAVILGESQEQMREVHALLLERLREEHDPMVSGFVTIESFVPSDQAEKVPVIEAIARQVNRRAYNRLEGEPAQLRDLMRDLSQAQPFTLEEIPPWSQRLLGELDGSVGRIGLLYKSGRIHDWNIKEVQEFQDRYGVLQVESGEVLLASSSFITPDVIRTVQEDGRRIGLLVSAVLIAILWISLRSFVGMLVCASAMGVAFLLTLGGMVLLGVKVGMYNMIVLPTVIGVTMDGAIHMYERYSDEGRLGLTFLMRTTGLAVVAATLTNASGFVGLLLQSHLGIKSIGELALIGLCAAMIVIALFMPGFTALLDWIRQRVTRPTRAPSADPGR